jgi:TPR repeat protein
MLGLGLTYDPNFLERLEVVGLQPDVEKARMWYLKALEGGAMEARYRLKALTVEPKGELVNGKLKTP